LPGQIFKQYFTASIYLLLIKEENISSIGV